jgi:nucleotidyltransferase substrate binding protein (TIGR01987 family)
MDQLTGRSRTQFANAVAAMEEALAIRDAPLKIVRDAVPLRFELAAELMPKLLRRTLAERGSDVALPKDAVRAACGAGLISDTDAEVLLSAIDDRNRVVHDYSEDYADQLFERVKQTYVPTFKAFLEGLSAGAPA